MSYYVPYMVWSPEYSVGDDTLDSHHRSIFEKINLVYTKMGNHDLDEIEQADLLDDLEDYADIHFRAEEAMMLRIGYPRLERHLEIHKAYRLRVATMKHPSQKTRLSDIMEFLKKWWLHHVQTQDMDYKTLNASQAG